MIQVRISCNTVVQGVRYSPGQIVSLTDKWANRLIGTHTAQRPSEPPHPPLSERQSRAGYQPSDDPRYERRIMQR